MVRDISILQTKVTIMANGNTEPHLKALDAALEWSKQITTLATGTLVLSATFIKDLFAKIIYCKSIILTCWVLMGVSILFGILYLGSLCSLLSSGKKFNIYEAPSVVLAVIQVSAFILGLASFVFFVFQNL